jgi:hypothetical protein
MRIVAILAAYNEARFIQQVIRHLASQGVETYLIDHSSTDGTLELARTLTGQGLMGWEVMPRTGVFCMERIARPQGTGRATAGGRLVHTQRLRRISPAAERLAPPCPRPSRTWIDRDSTPSTSTSIPLYRCWSHPTMTTITFRIPCVGSTPFAPFPTPPVERVETVRAPDPTAANGRASGGVSGSPDRTHGLSHEALSHVEPGPGDTQICPD